MNAEIVSGETVEISLDEVLDRLAVTIPGLPTGWRVYARSATRPIQVAVFEEGRWWVPISGPEPMTLAVGRDTLTIQLIQLDEPRPGDSLTISLPTAALAMTLARAHAAVGQIFRQGERVATVLLRPEERQVVPFLEPATYTLVISGQAVARAELSASGQVKDLGPVGMVETSGTL